MEKIEEVKQNPQQEQCIEQNRADEQDHETKVEDKVIIHMLEPRQTQGVKNEGMKQAKKETIELVKKPKQTSNQIPKSKSTIPRPFSLATDKRMNVDRLRSSDDVKPPKPTLIKSASFNYK